MKWIKVQNKLPEVGERVLVWVKYDDEEGFGWEESWIESFEKRTKWSYKEPVSGVYWLLGSAKDYVITHWMYINEPG